MVSDSLKVISRAPLILTAITEKCCLINSKFEPCLKFCVNIASQYGQPSKWKYSMTVLFSSSASSASSAISKKLSVNQEGTSYGAPPVTFPDSEKAPTLINMTTSTIIRRINIIHNLYSLIKTQLVNITPVNIKYTALLVQKSLIYETQQVIIISVYCVRGWPYSPEPIN